MKYLYLVILLLLGGCSSIPQEFTEFMQSDEESSQNENQDFANNEGKVHQHIESLARQLFDTSFGFDKHQSVIVGTFLPAESLSLETDPELRAYGLQLQESFTTLSMQAGLSIIEYKALPGVMVTEEGDIMMTRDKTMLEQTIDAKYLLSGNYIRQQNSLVVNVKLIALKDKRLLGAATGYVPTDSFYSQNKVQLKNGHFYRGED